MQIVSFDFQYAVSEYLIWQYVANENYREVLNGPMAIPSNQLLS